MNFSDFFGDPDPIVQEMAKKLNDYTDQFHNGQLTQDEYSDLVADAVSLNDAARAGKTVTELAMLDNAIQMMKSLASLAGGL